MRSSCSWLANQSLPPFGSFVGTCEGEMGSIAALYFGCRVVIQDTLQMSCLMRHSAPPTMSEGPDNPVRIPDYTEKAMMLTAAF